MQIQLEPPVDPEEFEWLLLDLWRRLLQDPDAQRYGRRGQSQDGIDLIGIDKAGARGHVAVQCKLMTNSTVSVKKLKAAVDEAKKLKPPIDTFVYAYSKPRDAAVQKEARRISGLRQPAFNVLVQSWDDLTRELQHHPALLAMYWPNAYPGGPYRMRRQGDSIWVGIERVPTADVDSLVARALYEPEVGRYFDSAFRTRLSEVLAELALNAQDHAGALNIELTVSEHEVTFYTDGAEFDPTVTQPPVAAGRRGNGLKVLRRFIEDYRGDVVVTYDDRLRINRTRPDAFRTEVCNIDMRASTAMLGSRRAAIEAAKTMSLSPDCLQFAIWLPNLAALSARAEFIDLIMKRIGETPVTFIVVSEQVGSIEEQLAGRWANATVMSTG